jgi:dipeptidyl aminopeptidase/acylaminoacyl peptidase
MTMNRRALLVAAPWALAACTTAPTTPAPAPPGAVLPPNENLLAQGIPPIAMSLVERVAQYTDFRGHSFVEWHPTRNEMLVAHRRSGDNVPRIYRLEQPLGPLQQLTDGNEPVTNASWEPRAGRYIVFERSQGGDEADQIYRLDTATRQSTRLTDPNEAHGIVGWVRSTSHLLYTSVPLDRTAQGGTRARIDTTLSIVDPEQPQGRRVVATLPGPGWFGSAVADDGRSVAFTRYVSAAESEVWLVDVASGAQRRLLPVPNEQVKATHFAGAFSKDGRRLFVVTDRAGEFRELAALDLDGGALTRLSAHIPWDVSGGALSEDGRWFVAQFNVDGRDEMRVFNAASGKEVRAATVPPGSIGNAIGFHRALHRLAFSINTAKGPSQVFALDPASGRSEPWTRAEAPPGIDPTTFADQTVVRWKSFDGLTISGIVTRPPARFGGRRPVIVSIHGGPEAQAQMGFQGRWNYFVQELGVTVIEPNVRLVGLRQDLPHARQRHEARGRGEGHRRAARLDRAAAGCGRAPRARHRRQLRRLHDAGHRGALQRPHRRRHPDRRPEPLRHLPHQHRELPPRPAARGVRRRARSGDARLHGAHGTLEQRREGPQAAVRRARQERPARALHRERADRRQGARQRAAGVVPARRERRPRLRAQGERRLHVLCDGEVRRAAPARMTVQVGDALVTARTKGARRPPCSCVQRGAQWWVPSKNCSSSVEPFSAAVEASRSIVVVTASK